MKFIYINLNLSYYKRNTFQYIANIDNMWAKRFSTDKVSEFEEYSKRPVITSSLHGSDVADLLDDVCIGVLGRASAGLPPAQLVEDQLSLLNAERRQRILGVFEV